MTPLPKLEKSREGNGLPRPSHKLVVELLPINQSTLNHLFCCSIPFSKLRTAIALIYIISETPHSFLTTCQLPVVSSSNVSLSVSSFFPFTFSHLHQPLCQVVIDLWTNTDIHYGGWHLNSSWWDEVRLNAIIVQFGYHYCQQSVWLHVSRIINVVMPCDPVILLLGIYLQGIIQHIGEKIFEWIYAFKHYI